MCKHIPMVVYDCGGTQEYCKECGKPLSEWKENDKPKKHLKKKEKKSEQSVTT